MSYNTEATPTAKPKQSDTRIIMALRIFHAVIAVYFTACLGYMYYAALSGSYSIGVLALAAASLALEGFAVFVLNSGNCPLIHVQRRIGDDKPFFELFMPPAYAKRAIPVFAAITWIGVGLLAVRIGLNAA